MKRRPLLILFPLMLVLALLAGCDEEPADEPASGTDMNLPETDASTPPIAPESSLNASTPDPVGEPIGESIGERVDAARVSGQPESNEPIGTTEQPQEPAEPAAPSAYVVIQNAGPKDPQLLVYELQQVLPKTQVVKQVQSPDTREIKLEVTNIRDVRALANKIPFASVESVDVAKRTITVDFDL